MVSSRIDFTTLDLQDALDLAVLLEEEACSCYAQLAARLELSGAIEAARFFEKMIGVEETHRRELAARRRALFGDRARRVTRRMIFDLEALKLEHVRGPTTARAALDAAMRSEVKAHDFFEAAIPRISDPSVKSLFVELRDEELEHQQWLRAELARASG